MLCHLQSIILWMKLVSYVTANYDYRCRTPLAFWNPLSFGYHTVHMWCAMGHWVGAPGRGHIPGPGLTRSHIARGY